MTPEPSSAAGRRLLAVFAHPDDESIASGGLLALAAEAGAEVAVLCLTRGEGGDPHASSEARQALAARREDELTEAATVLGVARVVVHGHQDGMLPWIDRAALDADIRAALDDLRPDVVVTFGPDGLYWHPDHIAVCERTTAVVAGRSEAGPALYYVTSPPGQMRAVADAAAARGRASWIVRGLDVPDAWGAHAEPPTLVVDTRRVAGRKAAAIACHRSQIQGGALDGLTPAHAEALLTLEHYRRAPGGPAAPSFIEAFGAPVPTIVPSPE